MEKITVTNNFHGTSASFRPQRTTNPNIGLVSKSVQARVHRDLCASPECQCQNSIESFGGNGWDVVGVDYNGVLKIKYHA